MEKVIFIIALLGIILAGCEQKQEAKPMDIQLGEWSFELDLGKEKLPFRATFAQENDQPTLTIYNAGEAITIHDIQRVGDSLSMNIPHFESAFHGRLLSSGLFEGQWHNYAKGPDYAIHLSGKAIPSGCTGATSEEEISLDGRWAATFGEEGDTWPAIGEFRQIGTSVRGTFLTETGDYRYLDGCNANGTFYLSTFDGAHAFLFSGTTEADGSIKGTFYSGNHYSTPWTATKNENAKIRSADSLTFLKEGYDKLSFSFPDLDGNIVSLENERFKGKAVIVQIMGSWCPNCLDETRLFTEWYNRYNKQGLEVIALAYEISTDPENAKAAINRFREPMGATYPFLLAGRANKKEAAETLPMLNHIMSFPTSIFIDKQGAIRKIHTGFSGPGTGQHYSDFVEQYERLIEDMLK